MIKRVYRSLFRPTAEPRPGVPFGARSVGKYCVPPGWRDRVSVKYFVQLFWCVRGHGTLLIDGAERWLEPGHVAFYFPGSEHHVRAHDKEWEYVWLTLDGPFARQIVASLGFTSGVFSVGEAPAVLFDELASTIRQVSREGELKASAVAYQILTTAARGLHFGGRKDARVREALRVIHVSWQNVNFGVDGLAEQVHCHRSTLTKHFSAAMGVPPVKYLSDLRTQHALSLLRESHDTVTEIALACGFRDPKYFARVIRTAIGVSPRAFRELSPAPM